MTTIEELMSELEGLRLEAELRSNDLLREEHRRDFSRATANAYAYCIMRLRDLQTNKTKETNDQTTKG